MTGKDSWGPGDGSEREDSVRYKGGGVPEGIGDGCKRTSRGRGRCAAFQALWRCMSLPVIARHCGAAVYPNAHARRVYRVQLITARRPLNWMVSRGDTDPKTELCPKNMLEKGI